MRLLLVTNDYPPKPGGIQTYLENLVSAYPDDVLVYAPADDDAPADEPGVVRGNRTWMVPSKGLARTITTVAADFAPDAILFGAPYPLPAMGPQLSDALDAPFGILNHGAEVTIPGAIPGARQMIGRFLRTADARFAVSRYTAARVAKLSGRPVDFIGAGVAVDSFTPSAEPPVNPRPVIGCVSRFVPRKGQDRLIEAVHRLDRDVEILFVGKGRMEADLRALATKLAVPARFEVDVPWADLPGLYQQMDVFCMPTSSRWGGLEVEGLGLVYLEAAATGLPVLAGDSGGSPETVRPGETGFVVSSVDDIVDGLRILVDDPARAREMGAAGRRFVEDEFTWERVTERMRDGFARHRG